VRNLIQLNHGLSVVRLDPFSGCRMGLQAGGHRFERGTRIIITANACLGRF
jgi:hypothetical protein